MRLDSKALRIPLRAGATRDPRTWAPALLVGLTVANLIALWFVWQTPGGSVGDLEEQVSSGQAQVQRAAANLTRLRALVKKVETARNEQSQFVMNYFIDRRTASSTIVSELGSAALRAGLSPREHSFLFEPVEGSNVFSMMTISANYEGRYSDLRQFISSLDRSDRFLIIEDITAAPQPEPGKLTARFKINAFVRETGGLPAAAVDRPDAEPTEHPTEPSTPKTGPVAEASPAPGASGSGAPGSSAMDASLKLAERRR